MEIILMDASEQKQMAAIDVFPRDRKPRIEHEGRFYEASRQDDRGAWIYRHIPQTK